MENSYISGKISVKAVLECNKRELYELYAEENKAYDRDFSYILRLAGSKGVKITYCPRDFFDSERFGTTHGGIGALVGDIKALPPESLLTAENPFIVLLDGIEDPFNFGCAVRSVYSAGATGVLLPERNWLSAAGTVLRASAGASERADIAVCSDLCAFIAAAKTAGTEIIAADRREASPLYGESLVKPLLLILGGEKRGISSEILRLADKRLYIPYGRDYKNALSASAAASVFAFEIMRQRKGFR